MAICLDTQQHIAVVEQQASTPALATIAALRRCVPYGMAPSATGCVDQRIPYAANVSRAYRRGFVTNALIDALRRRKAIYHDNPRRTSRRAIERMGQHMKKLEAISLLGGTVTAAARSIGVTTQAITQWPVVLTPLTRDRVLAALVRRYVGEQALIALARAAIGNARRHRAPRQKVLALD